MHQLIPGEIADALRQFGVDAPSALAGDVPLGQGVDFAYASRTGRLIHVNDDGQQLEWSELPESVRELHSAGVAYEWFSLAGMPYDMRADGLDLTTNRRAGSQFAQYESDFARALGSRRGPARNSPLIVDALRGIESQFAEVCELSDVSPRAFMFWLLEGDQHRGRQFIHGMTSYGTLQLLRGLRHANPQKRWEPNDRQDLLALSVALTSCDVVITEKYWCHVAKQAGFTGEGTARVYHSLGDALREFA